MFGHMVMKTLCGSGSPTDRADLIGRPRTALHSRHVPQGVAHPVLLVIASATDTSAAKKFRAPPVPSTGSEPSRSRDAHTQASCESATDSGCPWIRPARASVVMMRVACRVTHHVQVIDVTGCAMLVTGSDEAGFAELLVVAARQRTAALDVRVRCAAACGAGSRRAARRAASCSRALRRSRSLPCRTRAAAASAPPAPRLTVTRHPAVAVCAEDLRRIEGERRQRATSIPPGGRDSSAPVLCAQSSSTAMPCRAATALQRVHVDALAEQVDRNDAAGSRRDRRFEL